VPPSIRKPLLLSALSALSGGLLALSFPRFEYDLLAWIALVPLLFAVQNAPPSRRFLLGWLTGLVYFAGTLSWVTISMHDYGKLPWSVSYLLMLLLVAYLACYVGLFAIGCTFEKSWLRVLWAPVLWVALEYARGHLLSGFPWAALGYSQYRRLTVIQIADFSSVYGVGFLIVLVNIALFRVFQIWQQGWKGPILWEGWIAGLLLLLTLAYGTRRLNEPVDAEHAIATAVVQGNISQAYKWDEAFRNQTMETYKRLSQSLLTGEAGGIRPTLIVWPESATPFFFQTERRDQMALRRFSKQEGVHLLFGSPTFERLFREQVRLLNSAYLLSPRGAITRYDKMHLVPFGEYVPMASLLFFVDKMVEGVGDFRPGREAVVMEMAGEKIGTVICFEAIFPELVRQFADRGATLMTTITNDAWFGDSAAPDQHFSMVIFRAIENRVPFARAANTGISGFIDARGHILSRTNIFVEATHVAQLHPGRRRTFYTTHGDVFAIACAIIALTVFGKSANKRRPHAD
jgi:apolipoprotein N-acyltransferase